MLLAAAVVTCAAPLAGVSLAGDAIAPYLDFPPRTRSAVHAPFSWPVFIAMALPCALLALLLVYGLRYRGSARASGSFPWWGSLGVVLMLTGWICAWWEGLVPAPLRRHTFAVIWLGYILAINGCTLRASGRCPLTHRPAWYLALFGLSAAFWWLYEFLNQFVGNWYYVGIVAASDWEYVLQATVPFSTVLPAVVGTAAWLDTRLTVRPLSRLPSFQGGEDATVSRRGGRIENRAAPALLAHPALGSTALAAGTLLLAGIGVWPQILYPALWLGPLLLVGALQWLLLGESSFAPLLRGDWHPLLLPALAGLACGVLWELWNFGSAAKWHYAIPYVERFRLFEMPLLGYVGYLPFGVLCVLVADVAASGMRGQRRSPDR